VPTNFSRVVEPSGGWKHFFTMGLGWTWPVYSWMENYASPVETTNPWSDFSATLEDVGRTLSQTAWLSAHSCHLHAPFYLTLAEIQANDPWTWLIRPARLYKPYEDMDMATRDHFRRNDARNDPFRQYRIRGGMALRTLAPFLDEWQKRYPNLSGVVTSDHGEQFFIFTDPATKRVGHFTGVHGFTLDPACLRIPLHPVGRVQSTLDKGDVYSWDDLRDNIAQWILTQAPLRLTVPKGEARIIDFPTIVAEHLLTSGERAESKGAGVSPSELVMKTHLLSMGAWFLEDPEPGAPDPNLSTAIIRGDCMLTFNPLGSGAHERVMWQGYTLLDQKRVTTKERDAEIATCTGRRIQALVLPQP
jgi:hypothetical protein